MSLIQRSSMANIIHALAASTQQQIGHGHNSQWQSANLFTFCICLFMAFQGNIISAALWHCKTDTMIEDNHSIASNYLNRPARERMELGCIYNTVLCCLCDYNAIKIMQLYLDIQQLLGFQADFHWGSHIIFIKYINLGHVKDTFLELECI